MSRPKKHDDEKRTERHNLRFTIAEMVEIEQSAAAAGMKPTEFMRLRALGQVVKPAPAPVETQLISEINMIGVNLHQFLRDDRFGRGTRTESDWNLLYDRLSQVLEKVASGYGA